VLIYEATSRSCPNEQQANSYNIFKKEKGTRKYAGHKYAKENEDGKFKCRDDLIKFYEPYTRPARNHQFFLTKRQHVREECRRQLYDLTRNKKRRVDVVG